MNTTSDPYLQLTVVSLNSGQTFRPSPHANKAAHRIFDSAARGGQFHCQLGRCEVRVDLGNGNAVLALKSNDEPRALASVVWNDFEDEDAIWRALVERHNSVIKRSGFPLVALEEARPKSFPWLAISFSPQFHESASAEITGMALMTLAEIALGILRQERRLTCSS